MKTKVISERVYNQNQSWYFERVTKINGGITLKVSIRRNAYDCQSHAQVHKWNGDKWEVVVSAPISECECQSISYVQSGVTKSFFEADHNRLFMEAVKIVM